MKIALVLISASAVVLALRTWSVVDLDWPIYKPPLVYHANSEHPVSEVRDCILRGNGSRAFANFEPFLTSYRSTPSYPNKLLKDDSGSILFIGMSSWETEITLHSRHQPSLRQIDLLQWCSKRPTELWLPNRLRQ